MRPVARLALRFVAAWQCRGQRPGDRGVGRRASPPSDATNVAKVLAAAREALGGETRLSAVKTFTATGRTQQVRGNNLVPIEFEIVCELPDRYRRTDEIPAQESGPTSSGFSGDDLIAVPALAPSGARGPSGPGHSRAAGRRSPRARGIRQTGFRPPDARDVCCVLQRVTRSCSYAGKAEAPQGKPTSSM